VHHVPYYQEHRTIRTDFVSAMTLRVTDNG
jgi:hypothetical protein